MTMIEKGSLIVYSGPSGVGKGTILKALLAPVGPLVLSVSATTRAPREGEVNGREYHFVTREQFEQMVREGDMLEYAEYNGNYYGTPKSFVERQLEMGNDVILEIETKGAAQIKKLCPEAVLIFVMPPSYAELESRLVGRGTETAEQCAGRLKAALREIEAAENYDFIIVNDTVENARRQLMQAVSAGKLICRINKNKIYEVLKNVKTGNE